MEQPRECSHEARRAAGLPGHRAGVLQARLGADLSRHRHTGRGLASMPQIFHCLHPQADVNNGKGYAHTAPLTVNSCNVTSLLSQYSGLLEVQG